VIKEMDSSAFSIWVANCPRRKEAVLRFWKTLIVEDHVLFRQILREFLQAHIPLTAIEEAGNGKEALEKVAAQQPDLIFMDIQLPDSNGLKLTQQIKAQHQQMVIVILSHYDLPEYREAAFQNGANFFLAKGSSANEEILALAQKIFPDSNSCREG
jgi:DNA-binding NarL/FixJ family response regulator